ncbi:hypothetical protein A2U01_0017233, partial [Trifolium medium]|nr:hypothetical protein [Trifolium medium]
PFDLNLMAEIDYCGKLWQIPTTGNPSPFIAASAVRVAKPYDVLTAYPATRAN